MSAKQSDNPTGESLTRACADTGLASPVASGRSEARLRALVAASSDVVYVMNPDWSEMQPLDGKSLVASNTAPIRDWMQRNVPPFEHPRVQAAIDRAVSGRQVFELEHQVIRSDGSLGWTLSRAVPIVGEDGEVIEWFGTASDVTARKQAEHQLAHVTTYSDRQRRLYEAILACTPDFVYVFSLDHRILYANESLIAMWGHSLQDTIGKTFLEVGYEPWHAELHCREIDQVRDTKAPIRGEVPFTGTHGRRIYDYIFVPVLGADGTVEAVAGITRDVTDRKETEEALRDADRRKDDFIALLAHELRNPLAPIRNGVELIRLAGGDAAMVEKTRAMMDRQLSHMVRLIDDLLDISRINRNKMELRRARLSLAEIVASAIETARPLIDEAAHTLTVSLPGKPVHVEGDLTRLSQVFSNLLTNSAKYTEPGGRIWLTAELSGNEICVSVRDTGIGIPQQSLARIFDMFSQVDRSMERTTGGLGIGLALVKGLVEMHGGTIVASSAGNRCGSTFTVQLPALAEPAAEAARPGDEPQSATVPAARIMVVDDNRDSAQSLAALLTLMGNEVLTAGDGMEAVEQAEAFRPDVILMDMGMPRLNGLNATRRIREEPWGKGVRIIAVTGWGQDGDRERSHRAGCDAHLVKPVSLADLQKLLNANCRM